jgi:hypothetical protein
MLGEDLRDGCALFSSTLYLSFWNPPLWCAIDNHAPRRSFSFLKGFADCLNVIVVLCGQRQTIVSDFIDDRIILHCA